MSLSLLVLAPIWGVNIAPASILFGIAAIISLILAASLGFAMDFIFSAFAMRLKNGAWAALMIRESFIGMLSGRIIPFSVMPLGIVKMLDLLPFASLASTPLNIYIGATKPTTQILRQVLWNIIFWIIAFRVYKKSEEEMISFGG